MQQVNSFTLAIDPEPVGRHHFLDHEGNGATCLWFENQVKSLQLSTSFEVRTVCDNPFTYLVTDDSFFQLPVRYADQEAATLAPYVASDGQNNRVDDFAGKVVDETNGETISFLSRLCSTIYENFTVEIRHKGFPHPPDVTIRNKRGACRDLAVLYVAACRSVGLAARFVSGYQEGDENMEHPHLHAWAEVYIPGGGWRGYDPTHGLAVADRHIVLAASHTPSGASPVQGTFRGTNITAEMDYQVSIAKISS